MTGGTASHVESSTQGSDADREDRIAQRELSKMDLEDAERQNF